MNSRWLRRAFACCLALGLAGCIGYEQPAPQYGYEQPAPQPYYAPAPYAPAPYAYVPAPYYIEPSIGLSFGGWGGGHEGRRGR